MARWWVWIALAAVVLVVAGVLASMTASRWSATSDRAGDLSPTAADKPGAGAPLAAPGTPASGRLAAPTSRATIEVEAGDTLVNLGVLVEAQCEVLPGVSTDAALAMSQMLRGRRENGGVAVFRTDPGGQLVLPTGQGAALIEWGLDGCRISPAPAAAISGQVVWSDDAGVSGVRVEVCQAATLTDSDGRFLVQAIADGHAVFDDDGAQCPVRVLHPRGLADVVMVRLDGQAASALRIELQALANTEPDLASQADILTSSLDALQTGQADPAFERASQASEQLREIAERPELTPLVRAYLLDRADELEAIKSGNSGVIDEVANQIDGLDGGAAHP